MFLDILELIKDFLDGEPPNWEVEVLDMPWDFMLAFSNFILSRFCWFSSSFFTF